MISKEKQFIFIHNFKTGGTSIEKKLGHFDTLSIDVQDHRTLREIELLGNRYHFFRLSVHAFRKLRLRAGAKYFRSCLLPELTRREFDSYYKFTFVRNTWSRLYSWYYNILKDDRLRALYNIETADYSFEDFIKHKVNHQTFSQLYYLKDSSGRINMDFIGRFENLQDDFNTVCKRLQIEDSQLPKLLHTKYDSYTSNYTEETRKMVQELYSEEIAYFGFTFGE